MNYFINENLGNLSRESDDLEGIRNCEFDSKYDQILSEIVFNSWVMEGSLGYLLGVSRGLLAGGKVDEVVLDVPLEFH